MESCANLSAHGMPEERTHFCNARSQDGLCDHQTGVTSNVQRVSDVLDFCHGRMEYVKAFFEGVPVICPEMPRGPSNVRRRTRQSDRAGSKDQVWSLTRKCPTCTGLNSTSHGQTKSYHTTDALLHCLGKLPHKVFSIIPWQGGLSASTRSMPGLCHPRFTDHLPLAFSGISLAAA